MHFGADPDFHREIGNPSCPEIWCDIDHELSRSKNIAPTSSNFSPLSTVRIIQASQTGWLQTAAFCRSTPATITRYGSTFRLGRTRPKDARSSVRTSDPWRSCTVDKDESEFSEGTTGSARLHVPRLHACGHMYSATR